MYENKIVPMEDGRYRFEVSCDLSAFSLSSAYWFINDEVPIHPEGFYVLEVPSQLFSESFVYVYFARNISIYINTKYSPDEWSLSWRTYGKEPITVWSPGA